MLVGAGYFCVWMLFGVAVFPLGSALSAMEMEQPVLARAVPMPTGLIIVIAGALQFPRGSMTSGGSSTAAISSGGPFR
jgi:predicted metal-binding membrane protein